MSDSLPFFEASSSSPFVDQPLCDFNYSSDCFDPFGSDSSSPTSEPRPSDPSPASGASTGPAQGGGSVARRNERERKRVRLVNQGFAKLRRFVPLAPRGKRLSKVETLRAAIDYIRQLRQLLLYAGEQQRINSEEHACHYFYPPLPSPAYLPPVPSMDPRMVPWSIGSPSPSPSFDADVVDSPLPHFGCPDIDDFRNTMISSWPV